MSAPEVVTLRNGAEVSRDLVAVTIIVLEDLWAGSPITAFELVQLCKNPQHRLFGNTGATLQKRGLIGTDGQPHDAIRDIVLSAVRGEGFALKLYNPVSGAVL